MIDAATVNGVSATATVQSFAGTPATTDAAFGALLQAMTSGADPSNMPAALPVATSGTSTLPVTNFAAATLYKITDLTDGEPIVAPPITLAVAPAGTPGTKPAADFAAATLFHGTNVTDGGPVAAPPVVAPITAPVTTPKPVTNLAVVTPPQTQDSSGSVSIAAKPVAPAWFLAANSVVPIMTSTARAAPTGGTNDNTADAVGDSSADSSTDCSTTSVANGVTTSSPGLSAAWQPAPAVSNTATATPQTSARISDVPAAAPSMAPLAPQTAGHEDQISTDGGSQTATAPTGDSSLVAPQAAPTGDTSLVTPQTAVIPDSSTTPSAVPASPNDVASNPAAFVEATRAMAATLAAAQTVAPTRGAESGTPDLKVKAQASADAKPSSEKSKPVASEKTGGDKTGANKTADAVTAGDGPNFQPVQPAQDGQAQAGQTLNQSAPNAAAPQHAPATPPDGAPQSTAAATTAPPVLAGVAAAQPSKVAAELQVTAGHQSDDTSTSLDKLGITIAAKSLQGLHEFNIRLDPVDLGRVQIKLTVDDAGQAQASLVVDKPQTLDLLQRDSASLNRVLTDAGLNLSNNGLNFSLRDSQQQADSGSNKGRSRSLSAKAALSENATTIRSTSGSYAPNSVRLDIRV